MKKFALLGAGRIGHVHARAIKMIAGAELAVVYDVSDAAAKAISHSYGCQITSLEKIEADQTIDAVLICTPTIFHAEQIERFAKAGKAIFCEKPIDLDVVRIRACLDVVEQTGTPLMVGFNRRFDPHFMAVKAAIADGQIGNSEMAVITSRDPEAPPVDYIRSSGGIFRDMTIHDFDMAVFLLDELPVTVQAAGSVLTDAAIASMGDYDTVSVILTMASGRQAVITNSRRSRYGYDQRIEVHGSKGMVSAENQRPVSIELANDTGFHKPPLHDFFMTRYEMAYANEITGFVKSLETGAAMTPSGKDGLQALLIADAALLSAQTGKAVELNEWR